jgi:hypothetical protein
VGESGRIHFGKTLQMISFERRVYTSCAPSESRIFFGFSPPELSHLLYQIQSGLPIFVGESGRKVLMFAALLILRAHLRV